MRQTAQASHMGDLAVHTRLPWNPIWWLKAVRLSGGMSFSRSFSILSGSWEEVKPILRDSLFTWVSTISAGFP